MSDLGGMIAYELGRRFFRKMAVVVVVVLAIGIGIGLLL